MNSRNDFPEMLRNRGLTEVIVEVGVLAGEFSKIIYEGCKPKQYFLIDPWKCVGETHLTEEQIENYNHNVYDKCYAEVTKWASENPGIQVIRDLSPGIAQAFGDNTLDFVYIDASHLYDDVVADIAAWWPKVRKGGILAGHDYFLGDGIWVKKAVDEFAKREDRFLYHTMCDAPYLSWWVNK